MEQIVFLRSLRAPLLHGGKEGFVHLPNLHACCESSNSHPCSLNAENHFNSSISYLGVALLGVGIALDFFLTTGGGSGFESSLVIFNP